MSGSVQNGANNSANYTIAVNINPQVIPIQSSRGTIATYVPEDGSPPTLLLKQDDGKTTNWIPFAGGPGGDVISVNGFTGVVTLVAVNIPYDNTVSGLSATDVQGAIDELAAASGGANVELSNLVNPTAVNQDLNLDAGFVIRVKNNSAFTSRNALDDTDIPLIFADPFNRTTLNGFPGSNILLNNSVIPSSPNALSLGVIGDPFLTAVSNNFNICDSGATLGQLDFSSSTPSGSANGVSFRTNAAARDLFIFTQNDGIADANPTRNVLIETGNKTAGTGGSGDIRLTTGSATGGPAASGSVRITTGLGPASNVAGSIFLQPSAANGAGNAGSISVIAGNSTTGLPGTVQITSGTSTGNNGGKIILTPGNGGLQNGSIRFTNSGEGAGAGAVWTLSNTSGDGQWQPLPSFSGANVTLSNLTNPTAINQDLFAGPGTDLNLRTPDQAATFTHQIQILAGNITGAASGSAGGISIIAGSSNDAGSTNSNGGSISISAGSTQGDVNSGGGSLGLSAGSGNLGPGGGVSISAGATQADQPPGDININAGSGNGVGAATQAGNIFFVSGSLFDPGSTGPSGNISILTGDNSNTTAGGSGTIIISTGPTSGGAGGAIQIFSADPIGAGSSGQGFFRSGNTIAGSSGSLDMSSGGVVGIASAGNSGPVSLVSGSITDAGSSGATGDLNFESGDNAGSGVSGNIIFTVGAVNTGARGSVIVDALTFKLPVHAADPTGTFTGGEEYYNSVTGLVRYYNGVLATWSNL